MAVVVGAVVGTLLTLVLTFGIFFVSTAVPQAGLCNCACCLWPLAGGIAGAAFAIRMSGEGGAGKGAAAGALSGLLTGAAIVTLCFVGVGYAVRHIPNLWEAVRTKGLTDRNLTHLKIDVKNQDLRKDIFDLLRSIREYPELKQAFSEFKKWLTDDRIDAIVAECESERERKKTREFLTDIRNADYDKARHEAEKLVNEAKPGMLTTFLFGGLLLCGGLAVLGLFGGIIGGIVFSAEDDGEESGDPPPVPKAA